MFQIEKYHFDAASDFGNCIVIVSNRKIPFLYCILISEIALSLLQIANYHFYKAKWFWILYRTCFKYQNTIFVWKLYCYCFKYENTIFMLYSNFGTCIVTASNIFKLYPDFGNCASNIKVPFLLPHPDFGRYDNFLCVQKLPNNILYYVTKFQHKKKQ